MTRGTIIFYVIMISLIAGSAYFVYNVETDKMSREMVVVGKISELKFFPQSFGLEPYVDSTEIRFFNADTIEVIGNQIDKFEIGSTYKIKYHLVYTAFATTSREILSIEKVG